MVPTKSYVSVFTALALPNFNPLLRSQTYPTRKALAGELAQSLIRSQIKIETEERLGAVLDILQVLIKEGSSQSSGYAGAPVRRGQETEETVEEQGWLARIVHLIQSPSNDVQLKVIPLLTTPVYHNHTNPLLSSFKKPAAPSLKAPNASATLPPPSRPPA